MKGASKAGWFLPDFCLYWLLSLTLAFPWFWSIPLHLDTFAGDDLSLVIVQRAGTQCASIGQALTQANTEKYRPVTSLLLWATYKLFGTNFRGYALLDLLLFSALAALFAVLTAKAFRCGFFPGILLVLVFSISRFSYYNIIERFGLMEIAALFFCILSLFYSVIYFQQRTVRAAALSLISFVGCIHAHERYVVLVPYLSLLFFLRPVPVKWRRWALCLLPALILAGNFLLKEWVLGIHFFMGTGGYLIEPQFHPILGFFISGVANVLGFNNGPPYLMGFDVRTMGLPGMIPGALISAAAILLGVNYLRVTRSGVPILLFLVLFGSLILGASITIRLEQRWLLAPELILAAALVGASRPGSLAGTGRLLNAALLGTFLVGTLGIDVVMRGHLQSLFYVQWSRDAESTREVMINGFRSQLEGRPIYLVGGAVDPQLFDFYFPAKRPLLIPISEAALNGMTGQELENGLFFARYDGLWQSITPPPNAKSSLQMPINEATALDVTLIPELRDLLSKSSGNWYYTLLIGNAFMDKNPRKAEYYLREAIKLVGSGNPYPYFSLALLCQSQGRLAEAVKYCELAVRYDTKKWPNPQFRAALDSMHKAMSAN